jgi:multiple sugar transport system permease protein
MKSYWLWPYIIYIVGFGLVPMLATFYLVGVDLKTALRGLPLDVFNQALTNTIIFSLSVAVFAVLMALILAVRVDSLPDKWQTPLSLLILLPFTIPFTASTLVWRTVFDARYGLAYYVFSLFRLSPIDMITVPQLSIWGVVIVGIWSSISFAYLIILSGFKSVNKELREISMVDGATLSQYYSQIVIPYSFKSILTAFLITLVLSIGNFDTPFILTQGGPGYSSTTLPLLVYLMMFFMGNFSGGEVLAAVLTLMATIPAILLLLVLRGERSWVRLPSIKMPDKVFHGALWVVSAIILIFLIAPVYWMFLIAFRPDSLDFRSPPLLYPTHVTLNYFMEALGQSVPYIVTSIAVGLVAASISTVLAGAASYIMAKRRSYGTLLLSIYLYSLPATSFIFPLFIFASNAGLINTWWILMMATPIFTITMVAWTMFNIYQDVPEVYEEIAQIEGASSTYILFRLIMPITMGSWAASFILSFIFNWHLLFYPLVLTETPWQFNFPPTGAQTVTIFAALAIGNQVVEWGLLASAALIVALPVMVLSYIVMGRLLRGFSFGGVKG